MNSARVTFRYGSKSPLLFAIPNFLYSSNVCAHFGSLNSSQRNIITARISSENSVEGMSIAVSSD